jgi:hypothetical protein
MSVIEHEASYGGKYDLLEMTLISPRGVELELFGCLKAENIMKHLQRINEKFKDGGTA